MPPVHAPVGCFEDSAVPVTPLSCCSRDVRVYGHATTAIHKLSTPPFPPIQIPRRPLSGHIINWCVPQPSDCVPLKNRFYSFCAQIDQHDPVDPGTDWFGSPIYILNGHTHLVILAIGVSHTCILICIVYIRHDIIPGTFYLMWYHAHSMPY